MAPRKKQQEPATPPPSWRNRITGHGDVDPEVLIANQTVTQQATGGMTGLYLDGGTYIKSFYSVMHSPSCVKIRWIPGVRRLHHRINWGAAVPKIIPETYRKVGSVG